MNKDEIDDFFKKISETINHFGFRDDIMKILHAAMKKIEQGDFDYFCSKLKDDENYFIAVKMLKYTSKPEKLEEIIDNYEEYNIEVNELPELVKATKDNNYIIKIIEDDEKRKFFDINRDLVLIIDDEEYLQKLLLDMDKVKRLGINEHFIIREKYGDYNNFLKHLEKHNEIEDKGRKIELPEKMTIGIEIESEGKAAYKILGAGKNFVPNWECKYDDSLNWGVEVVSPILTGDTTKSTEEIKHVCNRLNNLEQKISDRCGGHVHIGADYLTKPESMESLIELWGSCEKILYIISNKEGELPRNGVSEYAAPISGNIEEILQEDSINLETKEDLQKFAQKTQGIDGSGINRYKGINFSNIDKKDKNTIEFRLANGTLDQNTWIENINLFGGMVKAAEEIGIIKNKINEGKEITADEQEKLKHFEKIKDSELTEEQKLERLLALTIKEQDRDIYRGRYNTNNKLLEQKPDLETEITKKISKSSIVFKKNQIAKSIFAGDNALTASDNKENDRILLEYLEKEQEKENKDTTMEF
ncbi:MAG: amidoligase family protein [Clostridia bacterium]|nr:amidoligase family protein [Clostridia bacterium]